MLKAALFLLVAAATALAQVQLAEGPGRVELEKICKGCHELQRSVSKKQDRDGWQGTMTKMVGLGMRAPDADVATVLEYLVKYYPADDVPPLNVNEAAAIELESRLSLRRSQASALVAYREKNGKFKSLDDLKKVPGIDAAKFDAKKAQIVF